ncbi:hypothetical protein KDI_37580 [Dictyobacter arantiisoli]|uniref:Flavoprotein domain-containing protein n=1 Tax=Dictyobacter arantiisoli TaxID=2014874 RepID=A0A5A5TGW4_9CHLR|nr:hypothetical protein KDI_37580 [Dictyobacter arantiisoli]
MLVCAALPAKQIQILVALAQDEDWDVSVFATPNARAFIDEPLLAQKIGHSVFTTTPTEPLASFTLAVVIPATFNTLRKWTQGITDTYVLELLWQWTQQQSCPILVFPRASAELAQDPAFAPSLNWLQQHQIDVFYQPELYPPNNNIPWNKVMDNIRSISHENEDAT